MSQMTNRLAMVAMSALLLLSSCGTSTPGTPTSSVPADSSPVAVVAPVKTVVPLSGEAIFNGLYFGQGVVAERFPEIWQNQAVLDLKEKMTSADQAKFDAFRSETVSRISAREPSFFKQFAADMQSGNPVQVKSALGRANGQFASLYPEAKTQAMPATSKVTPQCCGPSFCVVAAVVHVAAAVTSYVFVVGAVVLFGAVVVPNSKMVTQTTDGKSLFDDFWVADTATRLAL